MRKEQKAQLIDSLYEQVTSYPHLYIADIGGLDSVQTSKLRRLAFRREVKLVVVKNTLLIKALERTGIDYSELYPVIKEQAIAYGIAFASEQEIDEMNILWASMLAMTRAVKKLKCVAQFCLVDGNRLPQDLHGAPVVKGDAKSISIAAASIVAKETRDRIMADLAKQFPQYGWDKNAGYPTKSHLQAIDKYGINEYYRKTYRPVKERIGQNENSQSEKC